MKSSNASFDEQAYIAFLKNLDLVQFRMSECAVKADAVRPDPKATTLKMTLGATLALQKQGFAIRHDYTLIFGGAGEKPEAGRMAVTFDLVFHCQTPVDEKALSQFAQRFRDVNAPLITWPHYREFVQSMTGRMQWPPLVLPLMTTGNTARNTPVGPKSRGKQRTATQ